jgi:hypothetical protein
MAYAVAMAWVTGCWHRMDRRLSPWLRGCRHRIAVAWLAVLWSSVICWGAVACRVVAGHGGGDCQLGQDAYSTAAAEYTRAAELAKMIENETCCIWMLPMHGVRCPAGCRGVLWHVVAWVVAAWVVYGVALCVVVGLGVA